MSLTPISFGKIIDVKYDSFDVKCKNQKPDLAQMEIVKKRRNDDFSSFSNDKDVKQLQKVSYNKLRIFTGDSYKDYQLIQRNLGDIAANSFADKEATHINVTV